MDGVKGQSDAVVVGAGPAGAAVARRLADAGREVVLVEAGPGGPRPPTLAGLDLVAASAESSRQWPDLVVRDRVAGPARPYRQGFGLGGGSMINGMLLTPGDRVDYERWEQEWGCAGWGADDLGPWLERVGRASPVQQVEPGPISTALAEAAAADGLPLGGTSLDADTLGVLTAKLSALDDRRWSAADAHLDGDGDGDGEGDGDGAEPPTTRMVPGRSLMVVGGRPVERLVPDAAPGVHEVVLTGGRTIRTPQVVICAGTLGSTALLLRSGVSGRAIGRTMADHPSFAFTLVLRRGAELAARLAACLPVTSILVRWSSEPGWPGDLQAIAIDRVAPPGYRGPPMAVVAVGLMAVTSRGSVGPLASGAEPGSGPAGVDVVTGVLDTADDRRRLRQGVKRVASWLRSAPFADLVDDVHIDDDGRPLDQVDTLSDAELDRVLASRPGPYAHPVGTCPLGPPERPGSVVSIEVGRFGELLDRPGIRVADASVFPDLVRGGLQLPVGAVAARIADDLVASS